MGAFIGLLVSNVTAQQIVESLLAIPAFIPTTVCTGYLVAWFTDLHGFRQRSLVERIFWSIPLSLAVSTISSVLIGKYFSLNAVAAFFGINAIAWLVVLEKERRDLRGKGRTWTVGWSPLGSRALAWAIFWAVLATLSFVDFESKHRLFMSLTIFDHAPRVSWIESVLRTGVPPTNPLYWYGGSATMRYYYFWYVVCAAVARLAHLSARAVFIASCIWGGFSLAAIAGLYLKHFLGAGNLLRRQFLCCISLLTVGGLDVCLTVLSLLHVTSPNVTVLSDGQLPSWYNSLLFVPHHLASLICCMLAFLLASMAGRDGGRWQLVSILVSAFAMASASGLSIYVAFAFFVLVVIWGIWQVVVERSSRQVTCLALGGAIAAVLLLPYVSELAHGSSKLQGGALFSFAVRKMIPAKALLSSSFFKVYAKSHPNAAINLANLVLLIPGYVVELGFYLIALLIYLVPAWRGRINLTSERRSLLFLAVVTIPLISVVRSGVLEINDFGLRAALFLQFPLLLFGSEMITDWDLLARRQVAQGGQSGPGPDHPRWLRSIAGLGLIVGVATTFSQAIHFRFILPYIEQMHMRSQGDPERGDLSHDAYLSSVGYAELDKKISREAIVQFNPIARQNPFWGLVDVLNVNHQVSIGSDQQGCDSEFGGDPTGCPSMAATIDALYDHATAEQAKKACREYHIQYLIARVFDPAWNDKHGWVWTLNPAVTNDEFRAVDCR